MSQLEEIPTGTILAYIFFFKWHVKSAYFDVTDRRHYQTKEQEQEKTRTFSKAQVLQLNIKDYTLLVPFIQWTVKFAICIAQILICALGGLYWQEADRVCDVWIYWVSNYRRYQHNPISRIFKRGAFPSLMNKMFNVHVQLSWLSLLHLFVDRSGIRVAQYLMWKF